MKLRSFILSVLLCVSTVFTSGCSFGKPEAEASNKEKYNTIRAKKNHDLESIFEDFAGDKEENEPTVVKRKTIDTSKPMDINEAILQMEFVSHDFFIFKDKYNTKTKIIKTDIKISKIATMFLMNFGNQFFRRDVFVLGF